MDGVVRDNGQAGVRGGGEVPVAPVAPKLRVEGWAQPVQDRRPAEAAQHAGVDARVVVGPGAQAGQLPAGHQDHLATGRFDQIALLLVSAGHVVQRACRPGCQLVGAGAAGDAAFRLAQGAPDQLSGRPPVQPHATLRGVHGLGHTQAPGPEVAAVLQRGLPIQVGRPPGNVLGQRVCDHVGGGKGHPAAQGLPRALERSRWAQLVKRQRPVGKW